jgi:hypothetical protein
MSDPATLLDAVDAALGGKRCNGPCDQVKAIERFMPDIRYRGGRRHQCRDCENAAHRAVEQAARDRVRELVFGHYGTACVCCGSTYLLTIDHVDTDVDAQPRPLKGRRGSKFYAWLIRQGFPPGYQTMCHPCNASKGTGPVCRRHGTPARDQFAVLVDAVMVAIRPAVEAVVRELVPVVVPAAIRAWDPGEAEPVPAGRAGG